MNKTISARTAMPVRTFAVALLSLAAPPPAGAQAPAALDSIAGAFQAEHQVPGLAIGIVRPEGDTVLAYGVASRDGTVPIDANTSFEIGSIAKVFTGLLLAEMAVRGEVGLDDPLDAYLPIGAAMQRHAGEPVRLRHLATHTSGLPRLPDNLVPADMADPYAAYTADDLHAFLEDHELGRTPGEGYEYSNLGAGLLGHLLAKRAETTFDALLHRLILEPLGLDATHVTPSERSDTRAARGHAQGQAVPDWDFGPLAGAGGMRATPANLLRFLRFQLEPAGLPLADAIRETRAELVRAAPGLDVALGWHVVPISETDPLYWHNGGTGGFRSFAAFVPDREVGVVILANGAAPMPQFDQLALQIVGLVLRE